MSPEHFRRKCAHSLRAPSLNRFLIQGWETTEAMPVVNTQAKGAGWASGEGYGLQLKGTGFR